MEMTRLKKILNKYKEIKMARPKHRLDIATDKLYQDDEFIRQQRIEEIERKKRHERIEYMERRLNKIREADVLKEDMVNYPQHYTKGNIETIDIMEAKSTPEEFKGHLKLTALKYLTRAGHKESELQDAKKTQWYVNRWVKTLEKHAVNSK